VPIAVFCLLLLLFKKKIGGYTGDCCGALFLITELVFRFMTAVI
jgi:adenosylcobinamide-GDP ribazoletransferase